MIPCSVDNVDCEAHPVHPEDSTLIPVRKLRRLDGMIA